MKQEQYEKQRVILISSSKLHHKHKLYLIRCQHKFVNLFSFNEYADKNQKTMRFQIRQNTHDYKSSSAGENVPLLNKRFHLEASIERENVEN